MPLLTRPGVYVQESVFPTFVSQTPGSAVAVFCGYHPRGPLGVNVVSSWAKFVQLYGGFDIFFPPSDLANAVYNFFGCGGSQCMVVRAVGTAATASLVNLSDTEGAPLTTVRISALNPGLWGNQLTVDIVAGTIFAAADTSHLNPLTFTLVVKYQGSSSANIVERWENITMLPAGTTPGQGNYAPQVINSTLTGSKYITVTDTYVGTNTTFLRNPALQVATALTGGVDATPTNTDVQTAYQQLDQFPDQPLLLNLPNVNDPTQLGNAINYALNRGDTFVIVDTARGLSPAAAASFAAGLPASSVAAVYYPWMLTADAFSQTPGATRLVPPGGLVAGAFVATDATRGVAKAPAGLQARLLSAIGTEQKFTNNDLSNLNNASVNAIYAVPQSGVVIMGARTLSNIIATRYVNTRRTLIYLRTQLLALTKFAVFENNDYTLWLQINQLISSFLSQFWQSGGLAGQSAAQAFYIICDGTNNTPATMLQGIVNVEVGVAPQRPGEFIVITLGLWNGGAQTASITAP